MSDLIVFDAETRVYTVESGASFADIQSTIIEAPPGSTILFAAGTHVLDQTLEVRRGDIEIRGAGSGETTLHFAQQDHPGDGILIRGGIDDTWPSHTLAAATEVNTQTIVLDNTDGLAAGDVLLLQQANDSDFMNSGLYDNILNSEYIGTSPLREAIVEIASIEGNVITLKHAVPYEMAEEHTSVQRLTMLDNIKVGGFEITYDLGESDPYLFDNTLPGFNAKAAISANFVQGIEITDVRIIEPASNGIEIRSTLESVVDGLYVEGAHNKGGEGNGYAIHIAESFYGSFTNMEMIDVRHAVVFSSWHAEAYNDVHVSYTNRDINYHGSPDHSNKVVVDEAVYDTDGNQSWALVSPGSTMHPYTDISQNITQFGHAVGSFKDDTVDGWDDGARLYGLGGNDILRGGAGDDVIVGGTGNDKLTGGDGRDAFIMSFGDGNDTITDFQAGENGDVLVLSGYTGLKTIDDVWLMSQGNDTKVVLFYSGVLTDTIRLKNVQPGSLTADNFSFESSQDSLLDIALRLITDFTNFRLSSDQDFIKMGSGDDIIETYISSINAADVVNVGSGMDTMKFISTNFTFYSADYQHISGFDQIDVRDSTSARLILDDSFMARTDNGALTLLYGDSGINGLDTSALSYAYRVDLSGTGNVSLYNTANRVFITDATQGNVTGGRENDYFLVEGGSGIIDGGRGRDIFTLVGSSTAAYLGADDNDTFSILYDHALNGNILDGGAGFDDLKIRRSMDLDYDALSGVKNIEQIRIYKSDTSLTLNDGMFGDDALILRGNGTHVSASLDISNLTMDAALKLERNLDLTVTSRADQTAAFTIASHGNGSLSTGDGTDIITGSRKDNVIHAGAGDDTLSGMGGNDTLTGGEGRDLFVMKTGGDHDTITDFTAGTAGDVILLSGFYAYQAFGELDVRQVGNDVLIYLGPKDSVKLLNVQAETLTEENFQFEVGAIKNVTMKTSSANDRLISLGGNDRIDAYASTFKKGDIIDMGAGSDTLVIGSQYFTFNANNFDVLKGIEFLDVSQAIGPVHLIINDAMVAGSDTGNLTIQYGLAGITSLDISAVDASRSVTLSGNEGTVTLTGGDSRLYIEAAIDLTLISGAGNDYIRLRGGEVDVSGGGGHDTIAITQDGAYILDGGAGDDTFLFSSAAYLAGNGAKGGDGYDEIKIYDAATLSAEDWGDTSGIERITLYGEDNLLTLSEGLFDTALEVRGNSGLRHVDMDISVMTDTQLLIIGSALSATLHGREDGVYHIETQSNIKGAVHGTEGKDIFSGGTGNDILYGEDNDDVLKGGYGNDTLDGGAGNDLIEGGRGNDTMTGGTGDDVFVYQHRTEGGGDVITDFHSILGDHDTLDLHALFAENGLVNNVEDAFNLGYLALKQEANGVALTYDHDGGAKTKYTAETLVFLDGAKEEDIDHSQIIV